MTGIKTDSSYAFSIKNVPKAVKELVRITVNHNPEENLKLLVAERFEKA